MAKLTKRMRLIREKVNATQDYTINEAVALLKELEKADAMNEMAVSDWEARYFRLVTRSRRLLPAIGCRLPRSVRDRRSPSGETVESPGRMAESQLASSPLASQPASSCRVASAASSSAPRSRCSTRRVPSLIPTQRSGTA